MIITNVTVLDTTPPFERVSRAFEASHDTATTTTNATTAEREEGQKASETHNELAADINVCAQKEVGGLLILREH